MKRTLLLGKESHDVELLHQDGVTTLIWEGQSQPVDILELEPGCYSILLDGRSVEVRLDAAKSPDPETHAYRAMLYDGAYEFALVDPRRALLSASGGAGAGGGILASPMPGKIVKLLVKAGDAVQEGQTLLVMEAMKMQNELKTNTTGTVATVHVQEGATVETGAALITVVAPEV
ncbi:acetyl-CoA carboxylase biotin carboxyl carrier protein subunit [Geothrix limicola]|uniref:Acetyl-CoA carboxylase biotin carboxyl carrier protein subunit n=1 Tax=Geothrix limicola TaxID=2927978 RepID=A0ABQ5QDR3_9BACT|nr:acetyl-CoA carboxylase biotin carboxyl carrier protein subunit [Geothrix limicola]GLH72476.1 acetyl-CoA carboxylase biotin carboxyl carrier protein subunit [Geothrix limicola]